MIEKHDDREISVKQGILILILDNIHICVDSCQKVTCSFCKITPKNRE